MEIEIRTYEYVVRYKIIAALGGDNMGVAVTKGETITKTREGRLTTFRVKGLDCADCAAKLEKKLSLLEGVSSAKVNFGASKLTVEHDIGLGKILKTIEDAGYGGFWEDGVRSDGFSDEGLSGKQQSLEGSGF